MQKKFTVLSGSYESRFRFQDPAREFRTFAEYLSDLVDTESYFFLSCTYGVYTNPEVLLDLEFQHKFIIFFMADNPGIKGGGDYNWYSREKNYVIGILEKVAQNNPDKNFLLCHELFNLNHLISEPNLYECNVFSMAVYDTEISKLNLIDNKQDTNQTFLALNNSASIPRTFLLSYLYAQKLDKYGIITAGNVFENYKKLNSITDICSWDFRLSKRQINLYTSGLKLIKTKRRIPVVQTTDTISNFQKLKNKFSKTYISLVTESVITDEFVCPTEKYFYSVIGCNFPLIYSTKNFIKTVKGLGFDVFEDIVDHSYDTISNPINRLERLVNDNMHLLTDLEYTKSQWTKNKKRFVSNYEFLKYEFIPNYKTKSTKRFLEKVHKITKSCKNI